MKIPYVALDGVKRVTFPSRAGRSVQFLIRDPGDVGCLRPVVNAALADTRSGWVPEVFLAGWAASNLRPEDWSVVPVVTPFEGQWEHVPRPAVIVTSSSCSNQDMQLASRAHYDGTPLLYVEDNYGSGRQLLRALQDRCLPMPERICCIDAGSLEDLISDRPEFECRVLATSQPVFEAVLEESANLRDEARRMLGLAEGDRLMVYMGAPDNGSIVEAFAASLAAEACVGPLICTVRRHPRDVSIGTNDAAMFGRNNLAYQDTSAHATVTVARAADLVLAIASTELTVAALRRIPAAHLIDAQHGAVPAPGLKLPLPHTRAGTVPICQSVEEAARLTRRLFDPHDETEEQWVRSWRRNLDLFRKSHPRNAAAGIISLLDQMI